ncbi:MAG: putative beta-lactamase [Polaromonas sp.]|nr:putative beta-lactamase [Polaromonas sp.]
MTACPNRRAFLAATPVLLFSSGCASWAAQNQSVSHATAQLEQLEKTLAGRLGLFALDTASGRELGYRAEERFPLCSTFKVLAAAGVLAKSAQSPGLLQRRIAYQPGDLVSYSPITSRHVGQGMTVAELCAAGLQYSDNTAGNLMIGMLGGPEGVSAYARSMGDTAFRLDRWETALNSALPGDPRDTTTPVAMGRSLHRLVLGNALPAPEREQLRQWLLGNTTGSARIKAGIPADWRIGDKTGGGDYGTANDIAVLWPPGRAPVVVAIYTTQRSQEVAARNDVLASAARTVVGWLGNA